MVLDRVGRQVEFTRDRRGVEAPGHSPDDIGLAGGESERSHAQVEPLGRGGWFHRDADRVGGPQPRGADRDPAPVAKMGSGFRLVPVYALLDREELSRCVQGRGRDGRQPVGAGQ